MTSIIRTIKNDRGSLTVDYMFALVLVTGFCLVIMAFSATLVTVEVVQYAAYAGARRFFAGNMDVTKQESAGASAIQSVLQSSLIAPLVQNGWFTVGGTSSSSQIYVGPDVATYYPVFASGITSPTHNTYEGVVIPFDAKILGFQIPGFGQTIKTDYTGDSTGFTVDINSFLGREPTFSECQSFWDQRWPNIKQLSSSYQQAGSTGFLGGNQTAAVEVIDNGC